MPSSKLREATSGSSKKGQSIGERERLEPAEIVSGPRGSRAKKSYVVESESEEEEEDDEDAEGEEVEEDEEDEEEEAVVPIEDQIGEPEQSDDDVSADEGNEVANAEDDEEEEPEEGDESGEADAEGDEDVDMEDESPMPPPPIIKKTGGTASKPSVTITPAQTAHLKSVEAKEMEMEDDDEELSSIDSEGEAEAEDVDMDADDDDAETQSLGMGSRGSTPDVSKMTKRQRSRLDQVMGSDDFLQLPMEPQQKKILTAEEHAMRRAEMARRRKNLSEKRNEEEKVRLLFFYYLAPFFLFPSFQFPTFLFLSFTPPSFTIPPPLPLRPSSSPLPPQLPNLLTPPKQMDTINRLLKKQAPKRRGKISAAEISANLAAGASDDDQLLEAQDMEFERANPVFVRWVSDAKGSRVGVPGEWLEGGVPGIGAACGFVAMKGAVREGVGKGGGQRRMVEVVEG